MKSVLLGGLKVFLVNDGGKPLSAPGGRAKFYKAGTSTPETVYSDIDLTPGTALGPVVYTDELGYLPAIWLKTDRLYKVRIEQKVSDDPEQWALLWEVDNVGYIDPHETEEFGEAPIMVDSMAALKAVDHAEHGRVLVSGYYSAGDWGEPSLFVYDTESTLSVDDGYVVKPNDVESGAKGRWLQVFSGDVLDVRKFGAIPDLLENADVTAKVVNAVNYSQRNSTRSRPITVGFVAPGKYEFSGNFDFTIYNFVDLSDNSHHPINWFIGEDVVFKGSYSAFRLSKNTICLSRERLYEGTGCTLSVEGGGAIKVDPAWWGGAPCTITDSIVECHSVTTNAKTFDNCTINSNGFLDGDVTLVDMDFDETWFVSGYAWSHMVLSGVNYDVNDCVSANSYIDIKNSQGDYNYGNLGEQTVTDRTLGSGCIAENSTFSNVTIHGNVELHNVSGTVAVSGSDLALVAMDCWLTFSSAAAVDSIDMFGGSVSGSYTLTVLTRAAFNGTNINIPLRLFCHEPTFESCHLLKNVTQYPNNNVFNFAFFKCIFDAQHVLTGGSSTYVNGKWIDNVGNVADPVYIPSDTADEFVPGENNHLYEYSGNTGTFKPTKVTGTLDIELTSPSFYVLYDVVINDTLPTGKVALVHGDGVVIGSTLAWYNGIVCNPVVVEKELFSIGCKSDLTAFTGMKVKASVSFDVLGTSRMGSASDDIMYRETLYEEFNIYLQRTKKVSTASFKGFFKKFMQASAYISDDTVSSITANYEFSLMR